MDILARLADWPDTLWPNLDSKIRSKPDTIFEIPTLKYPEYIIKKIRVARLGHVIVHQALTFIIILNTVRSKSHRNFKMSISQSNKKINEKNKKWF